MGDEAGKLGAQRPLLPVKTLPTGGRWTVAGLTLGRNRMCGGFVSPLR